MEAGVNGKHGLHVQKVVEQSIELDIVMIRQPNMVDFTAQETK